MNYYIKLSERVYGPFSLENIRDKIESGTVISSTIVSTNMNNWNPAGQYDELFPEKENRFDQTPPMPTISQTWTVNGEGAYQQNDIMTMYINRQLIETDILDGPQGRMTVHEFVSNRLRNNSVSPKGGEHAEKQTVSGISKLARTYSKAAAVLAVSSACICIMGLIGSVSQDSSQSISAFYTVMSLFLWLNAFIFEVTVIYLSWSVLKTAKNMPRKGILTSCLLLFIPVSNLVWQFFVLPPAARDFNRLLESKHITYRNKEWAFWTHCIYSCVFQVLVIVSVTALSRNPADPGGLAVCLTLLVTAKTVLFVMVVSMLGQSIRKVC